MSAKHRAQQHQQRAALDDAAVLLRGDPWRGREDARELESRAQRDEELGERARSDPPAKKTALGFKPTKALSLRAPPLPGLGGALSGKRRRTAGRSATGDAPAWAWHAAGGEQTCKDQVYVQQHSSTRAVTLYAVVHDHSDGHSAGHPSYSNDTVLVRRLTSDAARARPCGAPIEKAARDVMRRVAATSTLVQVTCARLTGGGCDPCDLVELLVLMSHVQRPGALGGEVQISLPTATAWDASWVLSEEEKSAWRYGDSGFYRIADRVQQTEGKEKASPYVYSKCDGTVCTVHSPERGPYKVHVTTFKSLHWHCPSFQPDATRMRIVSPKIR